MQLNKNILFFVIFSVVVASRIAFVCFAYVFIWELIDTINVKWNEILDWTT